MNRTVLRHLSRSIRRLAVCTAVSTMVVHLALPCRACAAANEAPVFDIPRIDSITVDGKAEDWSASGFRVEMMATANGQVQPIEDFDAGFRLGWDDRGLLVLVRVRDDVGLEHEAVDQIWRRDAVQLIVTEKQPSTEYYRPIVSPGIDPGHPELRLHIEDHRTKPERNELRVEAARTRKDSSYVVEMLLPWDNLGIEPAVGEEFGFQLGVKDIDGPDPPVHLVWYPSDRSPMAPGEVHRVRMTGSSSSPIHGVASGTYDLMRRTDVKVLAPARFAEATVVIKEDGRTLRRGVMKAEAGRSYAEFSLPMPPRSLPFGDLVAEIADAEVTVRIPNADKVRARELLDCEFNFHPYAFSGPGFPTGEFERPLYVEQLIGPYEVKTTYYDRDYNTVTQAEDPGRYGAVAEIRPGNGRAFRYYRTLYCTPEQIRLWDPRVKADVGFPDEAGIEKASTSTHSKAVADYVAARLVDGISDDARSGALLAGLSEAEPGRKRPGSSDDVWAVDRQWWVGLKRKLNGTADRFPDPFVCPKPITGFPAPVVREATAIEAGVVPDAAKRIDKALRAWEADTDEAFAVCIVRKGVVVLHKAYGERDGRPMTLTDKSHMASITKLMAGTLTMMLVDQGLIDLDAPVADYLDPFLGHKVATPMTLRHLFTHTNGLWGHRGDDLHDFEQMIGRYYPYLEIGETYARNGAGFALGGKVIETVTGEGLPQFYRRHLLGPLGCDQTDVSDMSSGMESIPMDVARVGQMLLNGGAYGDLRFFNVQTHQEMLPEKLTRVLGPHAAQEYGIGIEWFQDEGLGEGTYGHDAGSGATLRIDPENELVIVMTRNDRGENFVRHHRKFLDTVVSCIGGEN